MEPTGDEILERRARNRALLARQLLLRRADMPVLDAVEHLVGLQAQAITPPYFGLWSRLEGFDPVELGRLLVDRQAVRMTLMRGTVHLVSVRDAALLRPLVQHVAERSHNGAYGRRMGGAGRDEIAAAVPGLLADGPRSARELGRMLVERGIGADAEAIGNAARVLAPLVQVPPRGVWGASGAARYAAFERWTGRALEPEPSIDDVVLRYLRAFGPATPMDAQNWSGLTRLTAVFERLRPRLVTFRDEDGRELFDLPDAPRPGSGVAAPVRFLGEFDNVLLGHADRRHVVGAMVPPVDRVRRGRVVNSVLVDGMFRAAWWIDRDGRAATLTVRPFAELSAVERDDVEAEAARMLDFAAAGARERRVRVEPPA